MARPPSGKPHLRLAISMKGSPEWKEWLHAYAASKRIMPSQLIDQCLASMAKREGYPRPPLRKG